MKKNVSEKDDQDKNINLLISNEDVFEYNPLNIYSIKNYDTLCEEHFKIKKIIPLHRTNKDSFVVIILNIFTIGIINIIFEWFTKWKKITYTQVSLNEADKLGIYCNDGQFYITQLKKEKIPQINNKNIQLSFLESSIYSYIFTFKLFTYIYNPLEHQFTNYKFSLNFLTKEDIHIQMKNGLNENEENYNRLLYGECDLNIEMASFFKLLFIEFSNPFYLFQIYSIILWFFTEYEKYAMVILAMSIFSLLTGTCESYSTMKNIKQMAKYSININKYIKLEHETIIEKTKSNNLVPGDIFELPEDGNILPCDCILLSGSIIINESMLTGESTPIIKSHLPILKNIYFNYDNDKQYLLFAGTKIVQKRKIGNEPVLAMVYNTGFNTIKGNLIRSILFPKDLEKKFKSDSIKYIKFMASLTIFVFILCVYFMIKKAKLDDEESKKELRKTLIERGLDLITITVPPSLPACLSIGTTTAISRLKNYSIMCIDREKMNLAGKINICVFDKTGTLTEDHLDIEGYIPLIPLNDKFIFGKFINDSKEMANDVYNFVKNKGNNNNNNDESFKMEIKKLFIECLACCQGITKVNDKIIGDPIDVKMFEGIDWVLYENVVDKQYHLKEITTYVRPNQEDDLYDKLNEIEDEKIINKIINEHYEIGIVKRFDFSSKLQRMSVLVKNTNESFFKCFVKGSPEKIKKLCDPSTLPSDFNEKLENYTSKGFRVLAMGYKMIDMNIDQCLEMGRKYAENDIIFLGLLIIHNKLKDATSSVLQILTESNLRIKMATGDNILTAISVGKKSNIIPSNSIVYSCYLEENENSNEKKLKWKTIENYKNDNENIDILTQQEIINTSNSITDSVISGVLIPKHIEGNYQESSEIEENLNDNLQNNNINNNHNNLIKNEDDILNLEDEINVDLSLLPFNEKKQDLIIIAITGNTFEALYHLNNKYLEQISKDIKNEEINEKLINYHRVFRLVLKYCSIYARMAPEHKTLLIQSLQQESFTVLMCGDGANDCGALKAADVGISLSTEEASIAAPFTSSIPDISCVINLLREGKSALVTSIQTFKYMMLYSMVQFISASILMCNNSYLSDWQFMASDMFIIIPLAFFIPLTKSYHKLTYHQPINDLISFPVITSILTQTFISGFFQFLALFMTFDRFPNQIGYCGDLMSDKHPECVENTSVFDISFIQYLITAIAFCRGKPFKEKIFKNPFLFIYIIIMTLYCEYIFFHIDFFSRNYLKIIAFPDSKQNITYHKQFGEDYEDYSEDDSDNPQWMFEFKYYIILISLINFVLAIIFEFYIIPFFNRWWTKNKIVKLKKEIEIKEIDADLNMINEVKNYIAIRKKKKELKLAKKNKKK